MAKAPDRLLTRKRQKWAEERGGAQFRGTPLTAPAAPEVRLRQSLEKMITEMSRTCIREVKTLYRQPEAATVAMDASFAEMAGRLMSKLRQKFEKLFGSRALSLSRTMQEGVNRASAGQLRQSLKEVSGGLSLKTDVIKGPIEESMKAGIKDGVSLIKSLPSKYFDDIEGAVFRSIQSGRGMADLVPTLERMGGISKRRAALIARDQTSKATTALNKARMKSMGVKQFEWLHSGGGKEPRKLHLAFNGRIFSLDDPPVIDERTGERGYPGQLINCRCRMVPVLTFGDDE